MKPFLLSVVCIAFCISTFAQTQQIKYVKKENNTHKVEFSLNNWKLKTFVANGKTFNKISCNTSTFLNKKGFAELPYMSGSIQLSNDKDFSLKIISSEYEDISLSYALVPSRGVINRNQEPSQIPFEIDPQSIKDEFYPSQIVEGEEPFIIRDVRGTSIRIYPFQYNSAKKILRVYKNIEIEICEHNETSTNPLLRQSSKLTREADGIYNSIFLNYNSPKTDASLNMSEYGDILVIATSTYMGTMAPYIKWKREKGYHVDTLLISAGTNVKSLIQDAYDNNPQLMFVQLVGDWDQIKSDVLTSSITPDYSFSPNNAPMDPQMGCVSGTDNYPDISIGRFSCSSVSNLSVQIEKAIKYEKEPNMDADWREKIIGIASDDYAQNPIGDDTENDYTHIGRIFSNKLESPIFTYNSIIENYAPNESLSDLVSAVNSGVSTIAYCGHGDITYWVTTEYSNTEVNASTNGDKLPFIVSVACVNGQFNNNTCFAEAWLQKANGGAVVTLMSTINQPWQPPQRGQDYFYDILSGGYNYDNDGINNTSGINTSEQRTHWGSICVNAANLMLSEASNGEDIATVFTWSTFGDASLQLRTQVPQTLTLSNTEISSLGNFSGVAKINNELAANVLICISQNNNYYSFLTDADGAYSIDHNFTDGDVLLVASAFNSTTIYDTLTIIPADQPMIKLTAYTPQNVKFNESYKLSATLNNIGTQPTTGNSTISISTDDPFITIFDYQETFGEVESNASISLDSAFKFSISNDAEDGHIISILANINNGIYTWNETFTLTVEGPDCKTVDNFQANVNDNDITFSWNNPTTAEDSIFDDFESHTAFTINSSGDAAWNYLDYDNKNTISFSSINFTNEGSKMAYIILNDESITGQYSSNINAYSGNQCVGFPTLQDASTNNDWLISPELDFIGNISFSFYARSVHSTYPDEQFEICYSTTGTAYSDFIYHTSEPVTTTTTWTKYTYTIPAGAKYVAIKCVSSYQYLLCIDDILIKGTKNFSPKLINLYADNQIIEDSIAAETYTLNNVANGYHCYHISTICESGNESNFSIDTCLTIGTTNIFSINTNTYGNGSITTNGLTSIYENQNLTFTVIPDDCQKIDSVKVNNEIVNLTSINTYTIENVNANIVIDAYFSIKKINIFSQAGENGSITPDGTSVVNCGDDKSYNITANAGYIIDKVYVNGANQGNISSYTFENVQTNSTISATFKAESVLPCDTPTNINIEIVNSAIEITWTASENALSYNILRNGTLLTNTTETNYNDESIEIGQTYNYTINTVCVNGTSANTSPLTITVLGINSISNNYSIYPNPTNSTLNIDANNFHEIQIFNSLGQIVYSANIENRHTVIDISKFSKGIYTLKLIGEQAIASALIKKI